MANDKIFCEKKKRSILGKTNEVWDSKKLECVNLKKREKKDKKMRYFTANALESQRSEGEKIQL